MKNTDRLSILPLWMLGAVFRDPSYDRVYMKTEFIDNGDEAINAIDLVTGETDCFNDDAKIYTVDATLYIKE